tara:strand:- start:244 stop:519 length:276 start_codon:yes stop_codon:yes gene_type:complete
VFNIVKPCKSCKSYILIPKEKFKLDLEKLKSVLETKEFKTKAYTGTLLSIEKKCKINIYVSGKIVVLTREEDDALNLHDELSSILYPYTKA